MAIFKYKALKENKKSTKGLVEASSEEVAVELLKEKGYTIIYHREKTKIDLNNLTFLSSVSPKDVVIFSRQFSVLVSASVSLVDSLKILVDQTENPKLRGIVQEMADEVDAGMRLSDSLAKRPKIFSEFYINVVKSGETSGKLDEVLNYLADELEKDYDMSSKIKGAMIYPVFVLCGLGGVGVIMMIFVVPKLTAVLEETGAELPAATKILIAVSDFLKNEWWLLLLIIVGLVVGVKSASRTEIGKRIIDTVKLKLPIFGHLFNLIYLVRFTRSMNTLIIGGVNISKGLQITADVVDNDIFQRMIRDTKSEVEDGNSISTIFGESKMVPKMVSQMMTIGEKTGRLDVILARLTDFYTREINNIVANLMTLMEPIIMVVMGVAVGLMVAAIILPMYNMSSNF